MIDDRNTEAGKLLGYKVGINRSKASLSWVITVLSSVVDPDSGSVAFLTHGSWIRNGGKIKIRIRDEHPGSKKKFLG